MKQTTLLTCPNCKRELKPSGFAPHMRKAHRWTTAKTRNERARQGAVDPAPDSDDVPFSLESALLAIPKLEVIPAAPDPAPAFVGGDDIPAHQALAQLIAILEHRHAFLVERRAAILREIDVRLDEVNRLVESIHLAAFEVNTVKLTRDAILSGAGPDESRPGEPRYNSIGE